MILKINIAKKHNINLIRIRFDEKHNIENSINTINKGVINETV